MYASAFRDMGTSDVFKVLKIAQAAGECNLRTLKISRVTIYHEMHELWSHTVESRSLSTVWLHSSVGQSTAPASQRSWVRIPLSHLNFSGSWDNCLKIVQQVRGSYLHLISNTALHITFLSYKFILNKILNWRIQLWYVLQRKAFVIFYRYRCARTPPV